jgi:acetyltransferase
MMNPVSDQRHVLLRDGTPVLIRRLMTEDAALYPDFLNEVTVADLRLRFFASMRAVSENLVDKLIHYDPAHAMAFIAVEEQSRKPSADGEHDDAYHVRRIRLSRRQRPR